MGNPRADEHAFPFLMLLIETLKDERNLEDSIAHWGSLNCNQVLDSRVAEWVRSFSHLFATLACGDLHQQLQVDTCWQTVHELGKPLFRFEILVHKHVFLLCFFWTASKWCNPKWLLHACHGPLRPDTDPPIHQFRSEPNRWEFPFVSVSWDDCYQTLIMPHAEQFFKVNRWILLLVMIGDEQKSVK